MIHQTEQLAVFIASENTEAKLIDRIIIRLKELGEINSIRAYANLSNPNLEPWVFKLRKHGIEAIYRLPNQSDQNPDSLSISIDVLDNLHTSPQITTFVIVSNEGDFSALANKIKSCNKKVIGIGNSDTPQVFRRACNSFIFTNTLRDVHPITGTKESLLSQVEMAFVMGVDLTGYCLFKTLERLIKKNNPDFNVEDYGKYSLFGLLHELSPHFEVIAEPPKAIYIKRSCIRN